VEYNLIALACCVLRYQQSGRRDGGHDAHLWEGRDIHQRRGETDKNRSSDTEYVNWDNGIVTRAQARTRQSISATRWEGHFQELGCKQRDLDDCRLPGDLVKVRNRFSK
jgi:hypothetical protein